MDCYHSMVWPKVSYHWQNPLHHQRSLSCSSRQWRKVFTPINNKPYWLTYSKSHWWQSTCCFWPSNATAFSPQSCAGVVSFKQSFFIDPIKEKQIFYFQSFTFYCLVHFYFLDVPQYIKNSLICIKGKVVTFSYGRSSPDESPVTLLEILANISYQEGH